MSATHEFTAGHLPALVSRRDAGAADLASYLVLSAEGQHAWTSDPQLATAFISMREATRMAFRLPANLRAYGLPVTVQMSLSRPH